MIGYPNLFIFEVIVKKIKRVSLVLSFFLLIFFFAWVEKSEAYTWTTTTLDSGVSGAYSSIALDSNNKVHIAYSGDVGTQIVEGMNYDDGNLKYITNSSGSWGTLQTLDSSGDVGQTPSIVITNSNKVYIRCSQ